MKYCAHDTCVLYEVNASIKLVLDISLITANTNYDMNASAQLSTFMFDLCMCNNNIASAFM